MSFGDLTNEITDKMKSIETTYKQKILSKTEQERIKSAHISMPVPRCNRCNGPLHTVLGTINAKEEVPVACCTRCRCGVPGSIDDVKITQTL